MDSLKENAGTWIAILLLLDLGLILVVAVLFRQWSLLRRNIGILRRGAEGENLLEKVASNTVEIRELHRRLDQQADEKDYLARVLAGAVQRVALVRYDAFEDMGGQLSFSLALLDEHGDGVVISSIYGRNEDRVYAKAVKGGVSSHALSPEEEEAVRRAMTSKPPFMGGGRRPRRKVFDIGDVYPGEEET